MVTYLKTCALNMMLSKLWKQTSQGIYFNKCSFLDFNGVNSCQVTPRCQNPGRKSLVY